MEKSKKKPQRYKRRIISGFTTLILLVAVVGCLYIVLQSMSNGYVRCGNTSLFRVVTGSMEPTIPIDAVLVAKETKIESIKKGDIVCFRSTNPGSEGMIVTHRVVGTYTAPDSTYCLQTKGDNKETNPTVDQTPVTKENLIGRVTWHTGDGSTMAKMINFLTGDLGFLACIVLPVLLVAVWVFRDATKNLKAEIQNVEKRLDQHEDTARLYAEIEQEVRKEMEQHAQACQESDSVAQEDSQASTAALSDEAAPEQTAGEDTPA